MTFSASSLISLLFLVIGGRAVEASTTAECNEKIRVQIFGTARVKCNGNFQNAFWSEREVDVSDDNKIISCAFSFTCRGGKRYIGIVKSTLAPNCQISKTEISHTSALPKNSIAK
jgi:hypothetical protein